MRVRLFNNIYLVFEVSVHVDGIEIQISNNRSIMVDFNRDVLNSLYTLGYADISDCRGVSIVDSN